MRRNRAAQVRRTLGAALLAAVLAAPVALAVEWNQKIATEQCNLVVKESNKVKMGIARYYDRADKQSYRYIVLRDVMEIHHLAVNLQSALRSGQGRDESKRIFLRLRTAVEQANRDAPYFPEIQEHRKSIDAADAALAKLAELYGV